MDSTTNPTQRRSSRKSKPKVYSDCVMFTSSGVVEDNLNEHSPSKQNQETDHEEQPELQSKAKDETNESSFAKIPCEPVAIFLLKNHGKDIPDGFNEEETIAVEKSAESGQEQTELKIDDYQEDDSTETSKLKMTKRRGRRPNKHQSETFSYDSVSKRYVCNSCSKTFRFRQDVQRHSAIHTGSKPYACNLCDKTFSRSDYLNTHLRIHKGIRDVFCDICGQSFYDKSNWRQHVDRCHGNTRPIPCPFENCPMRFRTNSDLKKHIPTHTREKPFQCDVCGRTFSLSSSLQHHLRLHTGEKPYSCDFCDKTFRDVTACRRHKRLHTGEKPYVCQICDKAFIQKGNLTRHFLTHGIKMTCSSVPSEVITQSQDIYDRVSEEIGHEFSAETDERKETKECDADLPPEVTFEEEDIVSQEEFVSVSFSSVRRSEQQKARWKHTYCCTYCNQVFTAADEANHHIRMEHPEPVNQSRVAKTEIVVVHNSDDPLSEPRLEEIANAEERVYCEVCLKDFRNILSLKQHMITHTDEKPFICEICGAGFRKNNNLLRHHLVHTGEKPFSCDICQKKFASVGNLKKHKVIHTGEKNYCCKLCGKAFSQSSNLKKHYVTHDSEKKARKGGRNYSAEEEGEEYSSERGTLTIIGHEIILTEPDDNPEQELEETEDVIGKANPLGCVLTIEGTDMVVEI